MRERFDGLIPIAVVVPMGSALVLQTEHCYPLCSGRLEGTNRGAKERLVPRVGVVLRFDELDEHVGRCDKEQDRSNTEIQNPSLRLNSRGYYKSISNLSLTFSPSRPLPSHFTVRFPALLYSSRTNLNCQLCAGTRRYSSYSSLPFSSTSKYSPGASYSSLPSSPPVLFSWSPPKLPPTLQGRSWCSSRLPSAGYDGVWHRFCWESKIWG